jgi:hypothetical protein
MEEGKKLVISFDIGIKNLACCVLRYGNKTEANADIIYWDIISLAATKEKIPGVEELALRLFAHLDTLTDKLEEKGFPHIDHVLVENQPSRLNGSMKTVQMMIYSYFQLRRHWEGRVSRVHMISASGKLKDHTYVIDCTDANKTGYELNKWKAIRLAEKYIQGDERLSSIFMSYKKKDDMSDALLQALAWLRRQKYEIEHACAYELI